MNDPGEPLRCECEGRHFTVFPAPPTLFGSARDFFWRFSRIFSRELSGSSDIIGEGEVYPPSAHHILGGKTHTLTRQKGTEQSCSKMPKMTIFNVMAVAHGERDHETG